MTSPPNDRTCGGLPTPLILPHVFVPCLPLSFGPPPLQRFLRIFLPPIPSLSFLLLLLPRSTRSTKNLSETIRTTTDTKKSSKRSREMLKALASASSSHVNAFSQLQTQSPSLIVCSSSSFRHSPGPRKAVAPSIRRPDADRCSLWSHHGSVPTRSRSDGGASTAAAAVHDELELFLELVPPRMRRELARNEEIRELIEVVMDLGRKPVARFPSGDWIMSEEPVGLEDLRHAISKVIPIKK
ncbi:hypothetical protein BHE74_00028753 [Ensete ventricosum]|nr:hypothetical protein GW17_00050344 [Ensete ventricosum]RWW64038.1 hypothetical protein BHE74_00028753 [Ensete ventricosum]RZS06078.1 hypothetical protein BHM03_00036675 [Ensete ventricosum]